MFRRDEAVENWGRRLTADPRVSPEQRAELESHLLDSLDDFDRSTLSLEEKFLIATHRIGHPADLGSEYEKISPWATWRAPIYWAAAGVAWALGVESVLEAAIPAGAFAVTRLDLAPAWMQVWAFVVLVGGPLVAFASVAAWMTRYSAGHRASKRALLATTAIAASIRLAAPSFIAHLNATAWKGFDRGAWHSFQQLAHLAEMIGLSLTVAVAAFVLVRFRALRV